MAGIGFKKIWVIYTAAGNAAGLRDSVGIIQA
jgi:hypothetical protein